jgi:hypothetical protein
LPELKNLQLASSQPVGLGPWPSRCSIRQPSLHRGCFFYGSFPSERTERLLIELLGATADWPNAIKIEHHKTGAVVWHPLEDENGTKFYAEAEAVLERLPRLGIPMILREVRKSVTKPYSFSGMQKIVHTMHDKLGLPSSFTLDACRHGGMTELEEAELTDGQGRALSAHKSQQAYEGYAKRTMERALSATRKRHAHLLANAVGTEFRNETRNRFRNEDSKRDDTTIKTMKGQ